MGSDGQNENARRRELCEFLKFARSRVTPAEAGLAAYGGRRSVGLRRDDVAGLCGVSVAWYTWFETGRPGIRASPRLIAAVARALRLDVEETTYLFSLAIEEMPRLASPVRRHVDAVLRSLCTTVGTSSPSDVPAQLAECDRLPVGIYCSTPAGTLLYTNTALSRLLGFTSIKAHMRVNVVEVYANSLDRTAWQRDIAVVDSLNNVVTRARRADGSVIRLLDSATAIRAQDDSIACYVGVWEQP